MIVILVASLVAILGATLWPFSFAFRGLTWTEFVGHFGVAPRTLLDLPRNIALFLPFGVSLGLWCNARGYSSSATFLLTASAGTLVSASVESLQIFLPGRTANVSDIVGNAVGSCVGVLLVRAWRRRAPPSLRSLQGVRKGPAHDAARLAIYVLFMVTCCWTLMRGMRPAGWDQVSEVVLARDTVDTPARQDTIRDLVILNRNVNEAEASQLIDGRIPSGFRDEVIAGERLESLGELVNANAQITMAFTVTPVDVKERADIVTLQGESSDRANLVIGQDETRLTLRWRSWLTAANGLAPAMEFPGVFRPSGSQRLVVSIAGTTVRVHASGAGSQMAFLNPYVIFSALLRETNYWPVAPNQLAWWTAVVPLSALMFVPAGVLAARVVGRTSRTAGGATAVAGALMLPMLLVEGFVVVYGHNLPRLEMLGLDAALTAVGTAMMSVAAAPKATHG